MWTLPSIRLAILSTALLLLGCGPSIPPPAAGPGAVAPAAAVERFLGSAREPDYLTMGWLFGTERGAILRRDPPADVERRMYLLADLLQHDRFVVRSESRVPGRVGNAVQLDVALWQRGREHVVPFTVVRGPGNRWYIEQIALEILTGRH